MMILNIAMASAALASTVYMGLLLHRITIPGLFSGNVQARGRHYTRSGEPIRYWFCIFFFVFVFLMLCFCSIVFVSSVWMGFHAH